MNPLQHLCMYKKVFTATSAATLTLALVTGSGAAQGVPVGTPGEPQCHGERISTGNQRVEDIFVPELGIDLEDFRLTPKGRTELLNAFEVEGQTDWTVQDFQERVRTSCEEGAGGQSG
jgi:hypothetical protein